MMITGTKNGNVSSLILLTISRRILEKKRRIVLASL